MINKQTPAGKVGILHPGQMGISVAAAVQHAGHAVYWASAGRGEQTRKRAAECDLVDAGGLKDICGMVDIIISVCPPHAAEELAGQVLANSFRGIYVDANAIAPERTRHIAGLMQAQGVDFVDGGIVGLPTSTPGETWLHLSGKRAGEIAALFAAGPMEVSIVGAEPGLASALKMCYAAYTKGSTALLSGVLAAAEAMGVRGHLERQWTNHWPGFPEETHNRIRNITGKAWRFTGEMQEIAATFRQAGMPGGFHQAAEEIYERMSQFKDARAKPSLDQVLQALSRKPG
jgi:3-hydroxyisobutyrate dehydrogenase-like beta-hydroxyacid dehydrogenase